MPGRGRFSFSDEVKAGQPAGIRFRGSSLSNQNERRGPDCNRGPGRRHSGFELIRSLKDSPANRVIPRPDLVRPRNNCGGAGPTIYGGTWWSARRVGRRDRCRIRGTPGGITSGAWRVRRVRHRGGKTALRKKCDDGGIRDCISRGLWRTSIAIGGRQRTEKCSRRGLHCGAPARAGWKPALRAVGRPACATPSCPRPSCAAPSCTTPGCRGRVKLLAARSDL